MIGRIRPAESRTFDVTGTTLADVRETALAQSPGDEWVLTSLPVTMAKNSTALSAVATFELRHPVKEVEGADLAEVESQVPEGWALLGVRH